MINANDQEGPPPCMIYVDKEGTWFHKGAPIIHRELLLLFYQSLFLDAQGRYIIKFKDQVCRLDVEDTPFVIVRTEYAAAKGNEKRDRFILHLTDDTKEELDPETLYIGASHVLYCKIRGGRFPARFSRPGYYQLAEHVQEEPGGGRYALFLNNKRYYLEEKSLK
ncbi:MAG: DUF1285 domain-containing protein [Thermodesulfobacteriota bacterium]|nr:DUF1285 domain-containing protein [Thermodesulfobacteriota bacterium]